MKAKKPTGPYNIELFSGSPDDNNSAVFFDGAMERAAAGDRQGRRGRRLRPDRHQADRHPGLEGRERPAADGLPADLDLQRSKTLDGVLSPNDTLARAIITSVKGAGKPLPVVTGQDSEVESVKSIMAGEQYSTINKDTRNLVTQTIKMVKDLQAGNDPPGQRHQVVQQRGEGRPVVPAGAGHRDQGERRRGVRQRPEAGPAHQVAALGWSQARSWVPGSSTPGTHIRCQAALPDRKGPLPWPRFHIKGDAGPARARLPGR